MLNATSVTDAGSGEPCASEVACIYIAFLDAVIDKVGNSHT